VDEGVQYGRIDILAIGRDLVRGDRQKRLPQLDMLPLFDVNGPDCALPEREDFGSSGCRGQIATHRLLAGILSHEQKDQDQQGGGRDEPSHHLDREGLKQDDLTPFLLMLLELKCLVPEQRRLLHQLTAPRLHDPRRWPNSLSAANPFPAVLPEREPPGQRHLFVNNVNWRVPTENHGSNIHIDALLDRRGCSAGTMELNDIRGEVRTV
jgi:hypothetical protein